MAKILQMKISLSDFRPLIWRRFLIEDSISFHELHDIIQEVMGWANGHLYQFTINGINILMPHEDYNDDFEDSQKIRLRDFLKAEKQKFNYLYDFGDSWEHSVTVEKVLAPSEQKCPVCVGGEMACPPEDCGGTYGYEDC